MSSSTMRQQRCSAGSPPALLLLGMLLVGTLASALAYAVPLHGGLPLASSLIIRRLV
jgi:hypothetical protein